MPYIPNPFGVGAIKTATYAVFGWTVQRGSPVRGNPLLFGLLRTAVGVLVELAFVAILDLTRADGLDLHLYLVLQVPRMFMWAAMLYVWFQPKGGTRALVLWTVAGTALSIAIDAVYLHFFDRAAWLSLAWL
jgi:ascorbate-specific PTS system EIIC-type component UlaA